MNPNQLAPDEQAALEQATAPRAVTATGLSAANAAEREAYLQLGQLLERAASEGFDEQAFLRKLQVGTPPVVVATPPRVQRRSRELWAALAVAAAAVAAVSGAVYVSRGTSQVVTPAAPAFQEDSPAVVEQTPAVPAPVPAPSLAPQSDLVVSPPAALRDWSDPLDERLAEMREEVREVARPYLMDTSLRMISEQVRELQADLDAGAL